MRDHASIARAIIDAGLYMVLGTADENGRPWASPVYYAPEGYRRFFWVSSPDARHSRNLQTRPELSIVVFDSSAPIDTGNGVYVSATARVVTGDEGAEGIGVFSRRSLGHGGRPWGVENVQEPAGLRLYRADALELFVLEPGTDRRVSVDP